jgi:hypothetical protein
MDLNNFSSTIRAMNISENNTQTTPALPTTSISSVIPMIPSPIPLPMVNPSGASTQTVMRTHKYHKTTKNGETREYVYNYPAEIRNVPKGPKPNAKNKSNIIEAIRTTNWTSTQLEQLHDYVQQLKT